MLTAFASYISYTNFGLITTAGNEIVMSAGAGDEIGAIRSYRMAINVTLFVVLPLLIFIVFGLSQTSVIRILNIKTISHDHIVLILACEALALWLGTLRGVMAAALYASGKYGQTYIIGAGMKVAELAAIATVLLGFNGDQVSVAAAICGVAVLEFGVIAIYKRSVTPWARFRLVRFDPSWVRAQIQPSVGFALANFATQGVLVQGPRVVLGSLLGGEAVALYAVYATAMRLTDQAALLIALPLEVEVAGSVGRGDPDNAYRLITLGTQVAIAAFLCGAGALLLFGPSMFRFWTAGKIIFDHGLMALFLCVSASNQIGRISAHALIGTNRMYDPGKLMLAVSVLALVCGGVLSSLTASLAGMVIGGIFGELAISAVVIHAVTTWLGRDVKSFGRDLARVEKPIRYAFDMFLAFRKRSQ